MELHSGRLRVVVPDIPEYEESTSELPEAPSPGRYIRDQRQRQGMSVEQLAAATKIPKTSIELLEADRYHELPGPVFVKGFLRCCARAVGAGPDAVMELLYERERVALNARRRERPVSGPVPSSESGPVLPRVAPRIGKNAPPEPTGWSRLVATLPSPTVLLWIIVAVFVGMVVLAAFNMAGSTGAGLQS